MRAPLDDLALFHDEDLIGMKNRTQSVSNHKTRTTRHQSLKGILNQMLSHGVDTCRCLVENE